VDDSVGALLETLEEIGELENTIFLFQIDHGVEAKNTHWENGNRIAQFVHYPKEFGTGGMKLSVPVSTIDIVPTLLDFANVSPDVRYDMDGVSWRDKYMKENIIPSSNSRCLLSELRKNRSLVCGKCHKLIALLPGNGQTKLFGSSVGFDTDKTKMYFNLCSKEGEYVDYPANSTESTNVAYSNWGTFNAMKDVLDCFLEKTSPQNPPDYDTSSCSFSEAMDIYRGITTPPAVLPVPTPLGRSRAFSLTISPTQECVDATSFEVVGGPSVGQTRTCAWVELKKELRSWLRLI